MSNFVHAQYTCHHKPNKKNTIIILATSHYSHTIHANYYLIVQVICTRVTRSLIIPWLAWVVQSKGLTMPDYIKTFLLWLPFSYTCNCFSGSFSRQYLRYPFNTTYQQSTWGNTNNMPYMYNWTVHITDTNTQGSCTCVEHKVTTEAVTTMQMYHWY